MNETTPTPVEVIDELGNLQLNEITAVIRQAGVRGVRGRVRSCPLARYVTGRTGILISVGDQYWYAVNDGHDITALPASCRSFVAAFDRGDIPDLEAQ